MQIFFHVICVSLLGKWTKPEAEVFKEIALRMGVPECKIILEDRATNTGENVIFSYMVLSAMGLLPHSIILIQMPHMERRVYATFMAQWPGNVYDMDIMVTSPNMEMERYPNSDVGDMKKIISVMLGTLQRIDQYPKRSFHIYQHIPNHVWRAYQQLLMVQRYLGYLV